MKMEVEVIRSTDKPERLVCQTARGDYYDGYVGDTDYRELMRSVDTKEHHRKQALQFYGGASFEDYEDIPNESEMSMPMLTSARTISFIQKQLSRGHYGPWEHPQITFAVEGVSRVTMAQITRHRHMTFDVQSQRYVDFSETEAIVPKSLTDEDHFSREDGEVEVKGERDNIRKMYEQATEDALDRYEAMVDSGIPKEDARFVLPLGTPVNMTFSGNARTFMHLLDMRKKPNAQWEIRELSERLIEELKDWMPHTYNHYESNAPHKLSP